MSIITGNKLFTRVVGGQQSNYLLSAKDDIIECRYDLSFRFNFQATSFQSVTILNANQLQLNSGEWADLGMLDGDLLNLVIINATNPYNDGITVQSINGNVLTFTGGAPIPAVHNGASFPQPTGGTNDSQMLILNTSATTVERIEAQFNLVENSGSDTPNSLIDGEVNQIRFNVAGLAISSSVSGTQVGLRSGGAIISSTCERITPITNYDFSFRITVQFYNWLAYEQGDLERPEWYLANQSIKPFVRSSVFRVATNPNSTIIVNDGFSQGNVGWYNENYNQGTNPFTFTVALTDGTNPVDGIRYNAPTVVTINVNGTGTFTASFLAAIYRLHFDDDYKNNGFSWMQNALLAYVSNSLNQSYGIAGAQFTISGMTYNNATPNTCSLTFTLTPSTALATLFEQAGFDNRYVRLGLTVQTTGGTATNNDRTTLLIWEGQTIAGVVTGQPMTELTSFRADNHIDIDRTIHFTEDDVRVHGIFTLNKADDYDSVGMKVQVVRAADGASFDLFARNINSALFPLTPDNKRLFNYSESLDFELPNPNRNEITLAFNGIENTTTYQVAFNFPFLFSWRYWQPKINAFNEFFDIFLPQNGKNDEWIRYLQLSGYDIRIRLELTKDGITDFYNHPAALLNYDDGDCTTVITIEDEDGNTLPALIEGQTNIIKAVHTNPLGWDLTSPWGWIAARPYEQEPRRLISSEYLYASNNLPLLPLEGQTEAELTVSGLDVIVKSRINPTGLGGSYSIIARVGDVDFSKNHNTHILKTSVVKLPIQTTFEDRGYKTCGEPRLALASEDTCCQWKNDVYGISLIADSITVELLHNGTLVPALGASLNFPFQENASGFIIDWRANLLEYGAGCVKVKVTYVIEGIEGYYWDSVWDLMPYSVEASENTVQLLVNYDDLVKQDGINYTGSGFYTAIRFHGFFGNEQINSQHNNLLKSNDLRVKVRNFSAPSYDLRTRPLTRCLTRPIKHMLLNASNIWVSDFNMWNHEEYRYFNVILSEDSGIEFEGDETFKRSINCVLLDKTWKTESKFSDKEAQPPNVSEIISCTGSAPCEPITVSINDVLVAEPECGDEIEINVTLNGEQSGTWNAETQTWEIVQECEPPQVIWDGDSNFPLATLDCGEVLDINCETLINGVVVEIGGDETFFGFFRISDGYPQYTNDLGSVYYIVNEWGIGIDGGDTILAEAGTEPFPWLATWPEGITVRQATISDACCDCEPTPCADGVVTVNRDGVFFDTVPVASGGTATINVPSSCPVIIGANVLKTGQTTSYRTGDDGDDERGRASSFMVLASNNPFGNTNRFTALDGTQTYANNVILDWSSYDGARVLGYNTTDFATIANWNTQIDNAVAANHLSYTNWRMANINEIAVIGHLQNGTSAGFSLNYAPFSLSDGIVIHSSTTNAGTTTANMQRLANGNLGSAAKTGTGRRIDVRYFTNAELGI